MIAMHYRRTLRSLMVNGMGHFSTVMVWYVVEINNRTGIYIHANLHFLLTSYNLLNNVAVFVVL